MNERDEFRDLAPLSPKLDPDRWRRMTDKIQRTAAPELRRRRSVAGGPSIIWALAEWVRPTLSGAVGVAAAAMIFLTVTGSESAAESLPPGIADELGFSEPIAAWIEAGQAPSVEEILLTMDSP